MKDQKTAGIIIIGSEILTGKVKDQNSPFLTKRLTTLGVKVSWIITIPDDVETIAECIRSRANKVDWVFTSGGVGPTHDDVTVESIARAFGVPLISHPELVAAIRRFYGKKCTSSHLLMARVPEGANLLRTHNSEHPVLSFKNVYIFPGVPKFLKTKFTAIQGKFKGQPLFCRKIELTVDEGEISEKMKSTLELFPGVSIGSYPEYCRETSKVDIFLEHVDENYLEKAYQHLLSLLKDYL